MTNDNEMIKVDNRANESSINSSRNSMQVPNIGAIRKPIFLTLNAKKAFNQL